MGHGQDYYYQRGKTGEKNSIQLIAMQSNTVPGFFLLVLAAAVIQGCSKDKVPEKLPDITISTKPDKGFTTDIFEITVNPDKTAGTNRTLFYRWDWNDDGIWDTPFSTGNQYKHRFLKPGSQVIRVECADGKKQVETKNLTITVEQGYTAPRPAFFIHPKKGNILTVFTFDAGLTRDDEDSISQLRFRWDLWGKGSWVTDFSSNPVTTCQYPVSGVYYPKMEVRDPSGRSATFSSELVVTMEDSLIIPDFSMNDSLIRIGDTLILDASRSYYSIDKQRNLQYSWYLPEQYEWTPPSSEKIKTVILHQEGQSVITLKVIDKETKLFNKVAKTILVAGPNLPPIASIRIGSVYGNILTQFYLDSWLSRDDEQIPSELEVRWDFDGNGVWDTPFSMEKTIFHQFEQPGEYQIILQVRDKSGLSSTDQQRVLVSSNTNPTGYLRDQRDDNFYGTVKIGEQWWMSQNMNYTVPRKEVSGIYQWICLFEESRWCDRVGKLYRVGAVVRSETDNEYIAVCPNGWRLPSREDWEILFSYIGGVQNGKELRYGGKYDFNALDLGFVDYSLLRVDGVVVDTVYRFNQTYELARFFSSTDLHDPIIVDNIWMWSVDRATGSTWSGFGLSNIYMPVRCLKE
jgi:uncharacterized protein (TIGR02145 family)